MLGVQRPILGAPHWGSSPLLVYLLWQGPALLSHRPKHLDPCLWLLCPSNGQHPHPPSCLPMGGGGPTGKWGPAPFNPLARSIAGLRDPSRVPKVARPPGHLPSQVEEGGRPLTGGLTQGLPCWVVLSSESGPAQRKIKNLEGVNSFTGARRMGGRAAWLHSPRWILKKLLASAFVGLLFFIIKNNSVSYCLSGNCSKIDTEGWCLHFHHQKSAASGC